MADGSAYFTELATELDSSCIPGIQDADMCAAQQLKYMQDDSCALAEPSNVNANNIKVGNKHEPIPDITFPSQTKQTSHV
jgi:hypothetical protein